MAIYVNYLSFTYSRFYLGPTVHMMTSRLVSECCVCVARYFRFLEPSMRFGLTQPEAQVIIMGHVVT